MRKETVHNRRASPVRALLSRWLSAVGEAWPRSAKIGITAVFLTCIGTIGANASLLYFQGFESNTSGWYADGGGDGNGSIVRTPSGGGQLGLTAYDGSYYAEVHNNTNAYLPGYGTGGYSFFGGNGATPPSFPGSSFVQSISVYINTALTEPDPGDAGFAIDMAPGTTLTTDPCYPASCADEQLFRLFYTGSDVNVEIDGSTVYTIGASGWYTFAVSYLVGATPTDDVTNDMDIFGASGDLLSSTFEDTGTNGGTLPTADLAGPGYVWLPQWEDGFSNNVLGIDDVEAYTISTPEPPSLAVLGAALFGFGLVAYRRRRPTSGR